MQAFRLPAFHRACICGRVVKEDVRWLLSLLKTFLSRRQKIDTDVAIVAGRWRLRKCWERTCERVLIGDAISQLCRDLQAPALIHHVRSVSQPAWQAPPNGRLPKNRRRRADRREEETIFCRHQMSPGSRCVPTTVTDHPRCTLPISNCAQLSYSLSQFNIWINVTCRRAMSLTHFNLMQYTHRKQKK